MININYTNPTIWGKVTAVVNGTKFASLYTLLRIERRRIAVPITS